MMAAKRKAPWAAWVLLGALLANVGVSGDSAALSAALKQLTKATEGVQGIVADVEYTEVVSEQPIHGTGKLYVNSLGCMRAEIGGDDPRTVLFYSPDLYVHRPADRVVEIQDMTANADWLARYLMVGFVPAGSAMKKSYDVELVDNGTLEGKPVFDFLLTPKAKKEKAAAASIARIRLWVDPVTGFPVQHQIVHAAGVVELNVRYLKVTRDDALPDALFRPEWPAGTTVRRK